MQKKSDTIEIAAVAEREEAGHLISNKGRERERDDWWFTFRPR